MLIVETLLKRADFVRLARARFYRGSCFTLRMAPSADATAKTRSTCRVGITVSKHCHKKAVIRNRIKRRLRAVVQTIWAENAKAGYDYVLIAKIEVQHIDFASLKAQAIQALDYVHHRQKKPE
jgi:ribonuclease P protein component